MTFYRKLRKKLKGKLKERELELLPRSYNIVGKILLIKMKPQLEKNKGKIGKAILEMLPYVDSVAVDKEISGKKRRPRTEIIAGKKNTITLHREHGCKFWIDISQTMFSKGNKAEKLRIMSKIWPDETIIDMFAGIGYWSVPIAKKTQAKKIYAIDINAKAIELLEKNVFENKVASKIKVLKGNCKKYAMLLQGTADRIIMGYFPSIEFLQSALLMAKPNAMIHLHALTREEEMEDLGVKIIEIGRKNRCRVTIQDIQEVKSYAPKVWHVVYDLRTSRF